MTLALTFRSVRPWVRVREVRGGRARRAWGASRLGSRGAGDGEVGRCPVAVETARRALASARRKSNARTRDLELRLRLYQVGRAYRQPSAAR